MCMCICILKCPPTCNKGSFLRCQNHCALRHVCKVDSVAEPVLLICAAYVVLDGLTIVLCGALKGCGRQMLQVPRCARWERSATGLKNLIEMGINGGLMVVNGGLIVPSIETGFHANQNAFG